jgi:hypothetical protein
MNWYKKFVKIASPLAPFFCPSCNAPQYVDVNQVHGDGAQGKSSRSYSGSNPQGECFVKCNTCSNYLDIVWSGEYTNMTDAQVHVVSQNEVDNRTRQTPENPNPLFIVETSDPADPGDVKWFIEYVKKHIEDQKQGHSQNQTNNSPDNENIENIEPTPIS